MRLITLVISGFLIQVAVLLTAQDTQSRNSISLEAGAGHLQRQDLVFSPMIHRDATLVNAGIRYLRDSRIIQMAAISFAHYDPMVTEPYNFFLQGEEMTAYPHLFTFVELDYMLGKRIGRNGNTDWIIGGQLTLDIQAVNYVYGRISHFGYYAAPGAGLFAGYERSLGQTGRLASSIRIPVVSLLARSPYLINDDEFIENQSSHSGVKTFFAFLGDSEIATWNTLQYFDIDL
ncbi:MAG: hypothetical protein EHM46_02380, partial [Bacteroidetes bacterium]